jgi:hypothetical protein
MFMLLLRLYVITKFRERESGLVVRDTTLVGLEKHISDFEGSQAVPARPSVLPITQHGPHRKHLSPILYVLVAVLTSTKNGIQNKKKLSYSKAVA